MKILGIETSCDDTAVALVNASGNIGKDFTCTVLGNAILSQTKEHAPYGGVFPNVAKREHGRNLVPVMAEVLRQAEMLDRAGPRAGEDVIEKLKVVLAREPELFEFLGEFLRDHGKPDVDCIAVTVGPGLEPGLWVGINFAKALSLAWNVPIVAVNHMEGHVVISCVRNDEGVRGEVSGVSKSNLGTWHLKPLTFPMLSLLISGGHTELVLSREWMHYEILGKTRDDAVGEAYDKVARMLGLPYPGGPHVAKLAEEARATGAKSQFSFTSPMLHSKNHDFSFAGLKTEVKKAIEEHAPPSETAKKEIALGFENAATRVLVEKTKRAVEEYAVQTVIVGGGVSANSYIRETLKDALEEPDTDPTLLFSPPELSTDNALMIALAGYFHAQKKEYANVLSLEANGDLKLTEKT